MRESHSYPHSMRAKRTDEPYEECKSDLPAIIAAHNVRSPGFDPRYVDACYESDLNHDESKPSTKSDSQSINFDIDITRWKDAYPYLSIDYLVRRGFEMQQ